MIERPRVYPAEPKLMCAKTAKGGVKRSLARNPVSVVEPTLTCSVENK